MSVIDDKKNVFTEIGAYNSLKEQKNLPDSTNIFSSLNNKNDIVSYLIDLLKLLNGSESIKKTSGLMFTNVLQTIEPSLKTQLKKQVIQPSSNNQLSSNFVNNGYVVPLKNIDTYNKYKENPNSDIGNLIYNKTNNDFDYNVYQAISAPNTDITYNNLILRYNEGTDSLIVKPTPSTSSYNINDFLILLIDGLILFSIKELTTKILNEIFGTVSNNQNKTKSQIINEIKINTIIDKIIENDNDITINQNELNDIENKATEINSGVSYNDLGCGILETSLSLNDLINSANTINNSTDPNQISNTLDNTLSNTLNNNDNSDTANNNKQTIKDNFFTKIIKLITSTLTQSLTVTPQIRLLLYISSSLNNNEISNITNNPENDIKNNQTFINCISNTINENINKFLFDLVKQSLIDLIIPALKKIALERINNYINIIKSLV